MAVLIEDAGGEEEEDRGSGRLLGQTDGYGAKTKNVEKNALTFANYQAGVFLCRLMFQLYA